jgi:tetratricopeptide (TPR) repeat protein
MTAPGSNENEGQVSPTGAGPHGEPHGQGGKDKPRKKWHERTSVTLSVAAALVVVGLGFIHIITGVTSPYELPFDVVRKDRFGYGETLVNAKRIRALPYMAATRRYPLGVRVLQKAGYMPGGLEFEAHMMARQREDTRQWLTEFEDALGRPELRWQDQLRGGDQAPGGDPEDARPCNQRGVVFARRGEYQAALAELTRAIRRDPTYADAFHNRALVYTALGNLGSAASDFGKVVEIRPDFVEGCIHQGRLHAAMNAHDQAIADFTRAIAIDPQCAPAYFRRSLACYAKGEYDKAWADVGKIRSLRLPVPDGFLQALRAASGADSEDALSSASR